MVTLLPARGRCIDERIARILGELPAELMELDLRAGPSPFTPQHATPAAVTTTLGSSVPVQDIGVLLRAMSPSMPAHLFASLVQPTWEDASLTVTPAILSERWPPQPRWKTSPPAGVRRDRYASGPWTCASGWLGEAVTQWMHGRPAGPPRRRRWPHAVDFDASRSVEHVRAPDASGDSPPPR